MKRRMYISILMACLSCVISVTSRPFSPHDHFFHQQDVQGVLSNSTDVIDQEEEYRAIMSRIGSRPPNCGHKCGVCMPCEAVQIPTTSHKLSLHFANYEPEGWKCKCGLTFFNP